MSIKNKDKLLIEKFLRRVPVFKNFSKNYLKQIIEDFKAFASSRMNFTLTT
jgi:hypothetical protein